MKTIYKDKIFEYNLGQYIDEVNWSNRNKDVVRTYLENKLSMREIGDMYNITGERVRQLVEIYARKAYHIMKKKQ